MGNSSSSDSWAAEVCNPRRNVMTVDHDPNDEYKSSSSTAATLPQVDCCGEICTPRRSVTAMVSKDRKASVCPGQDCHECPSDTRKALEDLCARGSHAGTSTSTRRWDSRRGYAPPATAVDTAAAAHPNSPRVGQGLAQESDSLNPRSVFDISCCAIELTALSLQHRVCYRCQSAPRANFIPAWYHQLSCFSPIRAE